MHRYEIIFVTAVFLLSFYIRSYADIVITKDEMILNGKIIEDKKDDYIKFANYHGTFHIDYRQIKEIHRTESFKDDIKIYRDKGISVDENEVKTNYESGVSKLQTLENAGEIPGKKESFTSKYTLLLSPFFNFNFGQLGDILPYSFGGSLICDIPLYQFQFLKTISLNGVRTEIDYFHSEKGQKRIIGSRISAGPLWEFPFSIYDFHFQYGVSPLAGIGWYDIRGRTETAKGVKWNFLLTTGPIFNISSFVISPQVKFDYINDGNLSFYGIGLGISFGYSF